MLICCLVIWINLCAGNDVAGLPVMPSHILLKTSPISTRFSMQSLHSLAYSHYPQKTLHDRNNGTYCVQIADGTLGSQMVRV